MKQAELSRRGTTTLDKIYSVQAERLSRQDLNRAMKHAFMVTCMLVAAGLCAYLIVVSTILPGLSIAKVVGWGACAAFVGIGYWAKAATSTRAPVAAFVAIATTAITAAMITNGGVTSYIAPLMLVPCLVSGFFLDIRACLVTALLIAMSLVGVYALQGVGLVGHPDFDPASVEIAAVLVLCATAFMSAICVGIMTSHLDVFSRRVASSRAQLESLVDNAPVALAMFDRQMRYVRSSRDWKSEHGLSTTATRGQSHFDLVPDTKNVWTDALLQCLGGETTSSRGESIARYNDAPCVMSWQMSPWFDINGSIGGVLIITRDEVGAILPEESVDQSVEGDEGLPGWNGELPYTDVAEPAMSTREMFDEAISTLLPLADESGVCLSSGVRLDSDCVMDDVQPAQAAIVSMGSEVVRQVGQGDVSVTVTQSNDDLIKVRFTGCPDAPCDWERESLEALASGVGQAVKIVADEKDELKVILSFEAHRAGESADDETRTDWSAIGQALSQPAFRADGDVASDGGEDQVSCEDAYAALSTAGSQKRAS